MDWEFYAITFTTPFFLPLQLVNSHNFQCEMFDTLSCRFIYIYIYIYSCLATSLLSLTRWHKLSPFSSRSCAAQIFLPSSQMFQANSKSVLRLGFRYISQKLSAHCFIILFPQAFISTSLLNLFLLTFSSVSITPTHLYPLKILLLPYQDTTLSYCHTPYALSQHLLLGVVHRSLSSSFSWPCPMI